jgi:hypothetical protein
LHVDQQPRQRHPTGWTSATRCWHQPEVAWINQLPDGPVIQTATVTLVA